MGDSMWRDDKLNPRDVPTAHTLVVCAEDDGAKTDNYILVIVHARTWRGCGFMPSVRLHATGCMKRNGEVHLGEDQAAYDTAYHEGMRLLLEAEVDLSETLEETETLARSARARDHFKKTRALPCMTNVDIMAVYAECVPPGDHSCGCDGASGDGCPWCTREKLVEWQSARVRARLQKVPS